MTTQTSAQRDSAYIVSTVDLLLETFDAQSIPDDIATVALMETLLCIQARQSDDFEQFIAVMKLIIAQLDKAMPSFMMQLLQEKLDSIKDPDGKFHFTLQMIKNGPSSIKLKDGKVVS